MVWRCGLGCAYQVILDVCDVWIMGVAWSVWMWPGIYRCGLAGRCVWWVWSVSSLYSIQSQGVHLGCADALVSSGANVNKQVLGLRLGLGVGLGLVLGLGLGLGLGQIGLGAGVRLTLSAIKDTHTFYAQCRSYKPINDII